MAVHDWQKVTAGIYHDFHIAWIAELRKALNTGILPSTHYALIENQGGESGPDLETRIESEFYARKRRTLAVRHVTDDRIVALLEMVSPGTKALAAHFRLFIDKILHALRQGIHVLVVDLTQPTRRDPQGIHGAIWSECADSAYLAPKGKPLTAASYVTGVEMTAYVEPLAVGDAIPTMPLFLDADMYVPVPLETTYQSAWEGTPNCWQKVLEE